MDSLIKDWNGLQIITYIRNAVGGVLLMTYPRPKPDKPHRFETSTHCLSAIRRVPRSSMWALARLNFLEQSGTRALKGLQMLFVHRTPEGIRDVPQRVPLEYLARNPRLGH